MIYDQPDLYDRQYRTYLDDFPFYRQLSEDYGQPVLELGAGTGRLSTALARSGVSVVGIEASAAMLERGRERLAAADLVERVTLLEGDMRSLALDRTFPVVIAPFNTLMHAYSLEDQDATLTGVIRHLAADGIFAFDLFQPRFGPLEVLRREAEWDDVGDEHSELFLVQRHYPERQLIETDYYLDTTTADGSLHRRRASLRQRYYTRFELERALRQAGFRHLRFFGSFQKAPLHQQSSLLVGIARR